MSNLLAYSDLVPNGLSKLFKDEAHRQLLQWHLRTNVQAWSGEIPHHEMAQAYLDEGPQGTRRWLETYTNMDNLRILEVLQILRRTHEAGLAYLEGRIP